MNTSTNYKLINIAACCYMSENLEQEIYKMRLEGTDFNVALDADIMAVLVGWLSSTDLRTVLDISVHCGNIQVTLMLIKYGAIVTEQTMILAFNYMRRNQLGAEKIVGEYQYKSLKLMLTPCHYIEYIQRTVEKSYYQYEHDNVLALDDFNRWEIVRSQYFETKFDGADSSIAIDIYCRRCLGENLNNLLSIRESEQVIYELMKIDIKFPLDLGILHGDVSEVVSLIKHGAIVSKHTWNIARQCCTYYGEAELINRGHILDVISYNMLYEQYYKTALAVGIYDCENVVSELFLEGMSTWFEQKNMYINDLVEGFDEYKMDNN